MGPLVHFPTRDRLTGVMKVNEEGGSSTIAIFEPTVEVRKGGAGGRLRGEGGGSLGGLVGGV